MSADLNANAGVLCADVRPLGIPAIFVRDLLVGGEPSAKIDERDERGGELGGELDARVALLMREYGQACGYSFDWGQLLEQRLGDITVWRVVPVAIWSGWSSWSSWSSWSAWSAWSDGPDQVERPHWADSCGAITPSCGGIVGLTRALHGLVRQHVPLQPFPGVVRSGCSGGGQRAPHALLSLLCMQEACLTEARSWMASVFLSRLLPGLLQDCRTWIQATCSHTKSA